MSMKRILRRIDHNTVFFIAAITVAVLEFWPVVGRPVLLVAACIIEVLCLSFFCLTLWRNSKTRDKRKWKRMVIYVIDILFVISIFVSYADDIRRVLMG